MTSIKALRKLTFYKSRIDYAVCKKPYLKNLKLLKALPFYKSSVDYGVRKTLPLKNVQLLVALPFYKLSIYYGVHKIRSLDNAELLEELPFYRSLNKRLIKSNFRGYAKSYAIEKIHNDPLSQLRASKSTIKELFRKLLAKMNGFKYIITLVVILTKDHVRSNGAVETEYVTLYFNSLPKLIINENFRDDLNLYFEEIINEIQNWIKEGSEWTVKAFLENI